MKESLIGKYYIPNDNSYSVNLTTSTQYPYNNEQKYLAGTYNTDAKICLIVSEPFMCKVRTVLNQISEIMMWNNNKKSEKQAAVNKILNALATQEIAYIAEVYLKATQINVLRASYSKLFTYMNSLKQWFRSKLLTPL